MDSGVDTSGMDAIMGRIAALEIMIATPAVRNLIRERKTFQIPSAIQTGKKYGMQSLDDSIMAHLTKKRRFYRVLSIKVYRNEKTTDRSYHGGHAGIT